MLLSSIANRQLPAAAAAAQETRTQGIAVLRRAVMTACRDSVADPLAYRRHAFPLDRALLRAGLQRESRGARLAPYPRPRPCPIIARPRRQRQIVLVDPQQRRSRAAQLLDRVEDQSDRLLYPPVRVLLQLVARLDEANRRADHKRWRSRSSSASLRLSFSPSRRRSLLWRGAYTVSWSISSVSTTRHISTSCCQLRLVLGKARDRARRHGADRAKTDFCHHALETQAGARARRRPAQVRVDDLDPRDAERLQPARHGVLQGVALAVVHDLVGRGLPDIEHRLAAQVLRPDLLRHHHRQPPDRGDRARGPASAEPPARSPSGVSAGRLLSARANRSS